jgi:hypothetical protein
MIAVLSLSLSDTSPCTRPHTHTHTHTHTPCPTGDSFSFATLHLAVCPLRRPLHVCVRASWLSWRTSAMSASPVATRGCPRVSEATPLPGMRRLASLRVRSAPVLCLQCLCPLRVRVSPVALPLGERAAPAPTPAQPACRIVPPSLFHLCSHGSGPQQRRGRASARPLPQRARRRRSRSWP